MKLEYPYFLFALFALCIPIIIHLFNFRKFKKIYFSDISLLKEVKEETQNYSRLKHLLLLASRILAIASLVLAFCIPYIPLDGIENKKYDNRWISIYLDNSFSMNAENDNGIIFEQAKEKTRQLINELKENDKIQLITNLTSGSELNFYSKSKVEKYLDDIQISSHSIPLDEVYSLQKKQINLKKGENDKGLIFAFTDLQKNFDLNNLEKDSSISFTILPFENQSKKNISIDSMWFEDPVLKTSTPKKVWVRIKNHSNETIENLPVKIIEKNTEVGLTNVTLKPNQSVDSSIVFNNMSSGFNQAKIKINDYPITFDDEFYFSYENISSIKVLIVLENTSPSNSVLNKLFSNDDEFNITNITLNNIDYSSLNNYDLVIFEDLENPSTGLISELQKYSSQGGTVTIIPGLNPNFNAFNKLSLSTNTFQFQNSIEEQKENISINYKPFYETAFSSIPKNAIKPHSLSVYGEKIFKAKQGQVLLKTSKDKVALVNIQNQDGQWFIFYTPLNSGNYTTSPIFVVSMLRITQSLKSKIDHYKFLGKQDAFSLKNNSVETQNVSLKRNNDPFEFIPQVRRIENKTLIYSMGQIQEADNYILKNNQKTIFSIGYNYSREESIQNYISTEEITEDIASLVNINKPEVLKDITEPKKFWKHFIALALLFLLTEILITKYFNR